MDKTINVEGFAKEVVEMMKQYTDDVKDAIAEETTKLGEKCANDLKQVILPIASEGGTAKESERRMWKNYSKSWVSTNTDGNNYVASIVHNKKHHQLTHLLEYGHMTRDGNRTRAFAHIKPLADTYSDKLLKNVKKIIEKGGKL